VQTGIYFRRNERNAWRILRRRKKWQPV